jgi:hypothetical protein
MEAGAALLWGPHSLGEAQEKEGPFLKMALWGLLSPGHMSQELES